VNQKIGDKVPSLEPTSQKPFKVGDKCIAEFELATIKEINDHGVATEIQWDSGGSLHSSRIPVFIRSEENLSISNVFNTVSKYISKIDLRLNFPDIHRALVSRWEACLVDPESAQLYISELFKFYAEIMNQVSMVRGITMGDDEDSFPLFR